jgi:TatD DNase family protein
MIFDTHAHYDDDRFDPDRDQLLGNTLRAAGIGKVMNVAADIDSVDSTNELSLRYEDVYAALGIHPSEVDLLTEADMDHIRELAVGNPKVRAIGEIGLDYHYEDSDPSLQEKWFIRQIELAKELGYPIIVHSRDAAEDTMRLLTRFYEEDSRRINGVVHCYSYALPDARQYVRRGFMIGVGGVVTFKNSRKLKEVVSEIPLSSIVLETDAPYLAPVPFRGERNDSARLTYVVDTIAEIKNISAEQIEKVTYDNALRLYGLS